MLQKRARGVWTARRLLRPVFGQPISVVFDYGPDPRAELCVILLDVLHSPHQGFSLKAKRSTGHVMTIPVALLRDPVDPRILFLLDKPENWPLPDPWVRCPQCQREGAGRFCEHCGSIIRRGSYLGEGFSAEQEILRGFGASEHGCGAMWFEDASFCGKCGQAVG